MTTTKLLRAFLAAATLAVLTASVACASGPPDKSGGGGAPVELTLVNQNDSLDGVPGVQRFVDRVQEISKGELTINVNSVNDGYAGAEQRVIRAVQSDKAQLAWVGTRVWDVLGVKSFRALHAPMLIDSYPLEVAVLRSDLPAKMLAGLGGHGLAGLALLGDNLRIPVSAKRPLRRPQDFKGLRIRSYPSVVQAAAFSALGARPSPENWQQIPPAFASGRLQAMEVDLHSYQSNAYAALAPYATLNLALWPRTTVLFANEAALDKLSEEQRGWIRQAADEAARYSLTSLGEDRKIVPFECRNGMKAVLATPSQLTAFRKAFASVYTSLRGDPATAVTLDEIAALKHHVPPVKRPAIPGGCGAGATARNRSNAPAFPQGVFRGKRTRAEVLKVWPNAEPSILEGSAATLTFRFVKGAFDLVLSNGGLPGCRHGNGRYKVRGRYVTTWLEDAHGCPGVATPTPRVKLRWTYDGKMLRFATTGPTYPLDVITWAVVPLTKIA